MDSKKINQLGTEVDPQQSDLTVIGDPISGQLKKITWLQVAHLIGAQASVTLQQVTDNGNTTTDPITTGGLTLTNLGTGLPRLTSGEFVGTYGYGLANGVATLDSGGKIPASQLPSSVMEYKGTWNASTNTPTLADGTGDNGDVYLVNVAGSQNLGSGTISFAIGDWVVYNGTIWQKSLNSNAVASVFGRTGTIVAQEGDYNIDQLGDVAITSAATNDYLRYNGSSWVNTQFPTFVSSDKLVLQVRNNSGATINKGTVVYINGASGGYPTIAKAIANADSTSAQTLGLVQDNISNNSNGVVVLVGQITGLDTSAYAAGTQLYLSGTTAGAYTSTKTLAPTHLVYVGIVSTSNAVNGVIEVKIQNGYELEEIHDVAISSVANNDGLFYENSTSLWKNKSIATVLGYTPADDANVVHKTGAETISGVKTFNNQITVNDFIVTTQEHVTQKNSIAGGTIWYGMKNGSAVNRWNIGAAVAETGSGNTGFDFHIWRYDDAGVNLGYAMKIIRSSGDVTFANNVTANSLIKSGGTSSEFLKADGSVDSTSYLPLSGGTMTGQLVLKQSSGSTDYTKGIKFPNDPFGGTGDTSGLRLYSSGSENQVLELYVTNDITPPDNDSINFAAPNNNAVTINSNKIWNEGNLPNPQSTITLTTTGSSGSSTFASNVLNIPTYTLSGLGGQPQLNGTGFVKASGTTISYDNSTYLTTSNASSTYIPYTGATSSVNLGNYSLTAAGGFYINTNTYLYEGQVRITDLVNKKNYIQIDASTNEHLISSGFLSGGAQKAIKISAKATSGQNVTFNTDGTTTFGSGISTGTYTASTSYAALFDGSVGIGTNIPSQKIHVVSDSTQALFEGATQGNIIIQKTGTSGMSLYSNAAGTLAFYDNNSAAVRITISNNGYVGINEPSPATFLHIKGSNVSNRGQLSIQSNDTNNAARASWYYHTTLQGNIGTTSSDFYVEAVNNLCLLGTNILIGTTTNSAGKLQINGGIKGGAVYATSGYVNETQTISTEALIYSFNKDQGNAGGSSSTTFNITGIPNQDGAFAFIRCRSSNTSAGINVSITVQVHGNTVFSTSTQNVTKTATFLVFRQNGTWVTTAAGTGDSLGYP